MSKITQPRILHIASGDLWAGAEAQIFTLAYALHNHCGNQVLVVLLNPGTLEMKLREAGMEVLILDESNISTIRIFYRLMLAIWRFKPDVIHTHRLKENILGSLAAWLLGNIPSLRTVHGAMEQHPSWQQPRRKIIHYIDWLCGRHLQKRIISVSAELAESLRATFTPTRVHTIENGIDLNLIRARVTRKKPGKYDTLRIGIAGRLVRVKRVDIFIETAHYLHTRHPDIQADFYIYGDGPEREEMERLSQSLGVDNIMHFEGHCNDMPAKLAELDILLMTSDHEGLPMVLLEAMAVETPIIAHAVGGITKLLGGGSCGVLVHEHSAAGFAMGIRKLANSPEDRSIFSRSALEYAHRLYSSQLNADLYLKEYIALTHTND